MYLPAMCCGFVWECIYTVHVLASNVLWFCVGMHLHCTCTCQQCVVVLCGNASTLYMYLPAMCCGFVWECIYTVHVHVYLPAMCCGFVWECIYTVHVLASNVLWFCVGMHLHCTCTCQQCVVVLCGNASTLYMYLPAMCCGFVWECIYTVHVLASNVLWVCVGMHLHCTCTCQQCVVGLCGNASTLYMYLPAMCCGFVWECIYTVHVLASNVLWFCVGMHLHCTCTCQQYVVVLCGNASTLYMYLPAMCCGFVWECIYTVHVLASNVLWFCVGMHLHCTCTCQQCVVVLCGNASTLYMYLPAMCCGFVWECIYTVHVLASNVLWFCVGRHLHCTCTCQQCVVGLCGNASTLYMYLPAMCCGFVWECIYTVHVLASHMLWFCVGMHLHCTCTCQQCVVVLCGNASTLYMYLPAMCCGSVWECIYTVHVLASNVLWVCVGMHLHCTCTCQPCVVVLCGNASTLYMYLPAMCCGSVWECIYTVHVLASNVLWVCVGMHLHCTCTCQQCVVGLCGNASTLYMYLPAMCCGFVWECIYTVHVLASNVLWVCVGMHLHCTCTCQQCVVVLCGNASTLYMYLPAICCGSVWECIYTVHVLASNVLWFCVGMHLHCTCTCQQCVVVLCGNASTLYMYLPAMCCGFVWECIYTVHVLASNVLWVCVGMHLHCTCTCQQCVVVLCGKASTLYMYLPAMCCGFVWECIYTVHVLASNVLWFCVGMHLHCTCTCQPYVVVLCGNASTLYMYLPAMCCGFVWECIYTVHVLASNVLWFCVGMHLHCTCTCQQYVVVLCGNASTLYMYLPAMCCGFVWECIYTVHVLASNVLWFCVGMHLHCTCTCQQCVVVLCGNASTLYMYLPAMCCGSVWECIYTVHVLASNVLWVCVGMHLHCTCTCQPCVVVLCGNASTLYMYLPAICCGSVWECIYTVHVLASNVLWFCVGMHLHCTCTCQQCVVVLCGNASTLYMYLPAMCCGFVWECIYTLQCVYTVVPPDRRRLLAGLLIRWQNKQSRRVKSPIAIKMRLDINSVQDLKVR